MLTILVKIFDNNTLPKNITKPVPLLLLKSIASTDTFVTILFTVYSIQQRLFFSTVIY